MWEASKTMVNAHLTGFPDCFWIAASLAPSWGAFLVEVDLTCSNYPLRSHISTNEWYVRLCTFCRHVLPFFTWWTNKALRIIIDQIYTQIKSPAVPRRLYCFQCCHCHRPLHQHCLGFCHHLCETCILGSSWMMFAAEGIIKQASL